MADSPIELLSCGGRVPLSTVKGETQAHSHPESGAPTGLTGVGTGTWTWGTRASSRALRVPGGCRLLWEPSVGAARHPRHHPWGRTRAPAQSRDFPLVGSLGNRRGHKAPPELFLPWRRRVWERTLSPSLPEQLLTG